MLEVISLLQAMVERGLIYSLVVIAVYLTSRIIKFDDLTVEGSFGIGGALTACCLIYNFHPCVVVAITMAAGGLTGCITGILHTQLNINNLISGIVVTTGLFSVILYLAGANQSIMGLTTIFDLLPDFVGGYHFLIILLMLNIIVLFFLRWFMHSEPGFLIQAVGDNPQMLTNLGKNIKAYKITALMLANMLTALAGSLFVQYVGYYSIWASVGILVSALAGLILAELLGSTLDSSLVIGSILYQAIIAITFELQVPQEWNKLITAGLIVLLLMLKSPRFLLGRK